MNIMLRRRKNIASFLLLVFLTNMLTPTVAYALTSGPAQPEVQGFQPAGVSDMVNLENGDFKYNIPLLDIDGYPLNLSYQSGVGMDDEASWVGLGWSLNTGAITRQVRGIPDDFNGTDMLNVQHFTAPKVTVGGKVNIKAELFGINGLSGSLSMGVFSDNYTGIGAEVGGNVGISLSNCMDTKFTASLGLGITSNTQSGADIVGSVGISPSGNFDLLNKTNAKLTVSSGLTSSLGYNSRSGLKALSLGATFNFKAQTRNFGINQDFDAFKSNISYNTEPVSPKIEVPYSTAYDSYSFDLGPEIVGVYPSIGGTGYKSVTKVSQSSVNKPAYGFLYAERGKNDPNAVMDMIRENDNLLLPETPNVAIPIHTPDLWSYTSQAGSGQFRLYRGGSGIFFDNQVSNVSNSNSTGGDYGIGLYFHGGITHFNQSGKSTTRKWVANNPYIAASGDFQDAVIKNPASQQVYFKQVGEKNIENKNVNNILYGDAPLTVNLDGVNAANTFAVGGDSPVANASVPSLDQNAVTRRPTHTNITYLTAAEASSAGLDQQLKVYNFNNYGSFSPSPDNPFTTVSRVDNIRKAHHISEINVTGADGKRMVYGIPVYNTKHEEYSFAVSPTTGPVADAPDSGVPIPLNVEKNSMGVDNYFHAESKPPYATSFLLTGILSPDYVDKTGDGITPDDLGTAIKFNYARINNFKWRAPFTNATFNKGLLADPDDNKGSVIYGEKELWYISSIETKTKIVYFITENREDAYGVNSGWKMGGIDTNQPQKRLREIRLYSRADLSKPIKVIKLQYDNHLCQNIPNYWSPLLDNSPKGKLTLTAISFAYGNSKKGDNHPYQFKYVDDNFTPINYSYMSTDRWGTYKPNSGNPGGLNNNAFPYTSQTKNDATDAMSAAWCLNEVDLPTGGTIKVNYESKDYAYVQDKKAAVMTQILGFAVYSQAASTGQATVVPPTASLLNNADAVKVYIGENAPLNTNDVTQWFENTYLNGSNYIYTRTWVKMSTTNCSSRGLNNDYDFVPCYAKVKAVAIASNVAIIQLEGITAGGVPNMNPVQIAAWQKMRLDYPRYAYPGFNNRIQSQSMPVIAAVGAILNAIGNLSELVEPFYKKANNNSNNYGGQYDLTKSFVKLVRRDGKKLGGGTRVKQITINDNWDNANSQVVAGATSAAQYGQSYNYTTVGDDGSTISSGVASYEPSIGNDENPLKEPVLYTEKIKGAINNYYSIEKPFCESLYPAPSITYSKVTVQDLDANRQPSLKTGYIVNEFYTAKDFPVKVTAMDIQSAEYKPTSLYSLIQTNSIDEKALSQGYSIELNDMAGKTKATHVFNQSGSEISSTVYQYRTRASDPTRLDNLVTTVNSSNAVNQNYMGRDIEFFSDFREDENSNVGQTVNIGGDVFPCPVPWGFLAILYKPYGVNNEYKLFRTAATLKVVQLYGILSKVIKTQNGSSISTEDMAYDESTGDAIVTRTQNEFNNYIYSVNIPAYWAHINMGGAYQTSGTIIADLKTDDSGRIPAGTYYDALMEGDELLNLKDGTKYWVVCSIPTYQQLPGAPDTINNGHPPGWAANQKLHIDPAAMMAYADMSDDQSGYTKGGPSATDQDNVEAAPVRPQVITPVYHSNYNGYHDKYLITRNGSIMPNFNSTGTNPLAMVKVVRSGYRNLLDASVSSIVCLNNPIVGNRLLLNVSDDQSALKAINTSAATYTGVWAMPAHNPAVAATESAGFNTLAAGGPHGVHASAGVIVYNQPVPPSYTLTPTVIQNPALQARFDASAVWPGSPPSTPGAPYNTSNLPLQVPLGFETDFTVPGDGTYYIGYSGDNEFVYTVDGVPMPFTSNNQPTPGYYWFLYPLPLKAGTHHIRAQVTNDSFPPGSSLPNDLTYNPGDICIEVYNNTLSQLTSGTITPVFTSASLRQNPKVQTFIMTTNPTNNQPLQSNRYRYHINPFIDGFYGNWRPYQTMVLQQARTYKSGIFDAPNSGVDVKNAGYIDQFASYWRYDPNSGIWVPNTGQSHWVIANTVTLYDKYGQQLENKDALGRYSAAKFDFNGELPSAVASNAMNNEIFACSFEDATFTQGADLTAKKQPQFLNGANPPTLSATVSHSGNYAAFLPSSGLTLSTNYTNSPLDRNALSMLNLTASPLITNDHSEFNIQSSNSVFYPLGFAPNPGKKYVYDVWINDGTPGDKSVNVNLSVNGTDATAQTCRAVVEGWKLIEGTFTTPVNTYNATLTLTPKNGKSVMVDDIRIFPFDSHIKTYVYNNKNLRLMAELDENCFATFYEYDDEGLLVRVKKETEKGLMTLRESRSSYKKVNAIAP